MPAMAQGDACRIDYGKPGQVKDANKAVETSEVIGKPEDKRKAFTRAVTLLTKEPEKVRVNQIAADMVLGRALIDLADAARHAVEGSSRRRRLHDGSRCDHRPARLGGLAARWRRGADAGLQGRDRRRGVALRTACS